MGNWKLMEARVKGRKKREIYRSRGRLKGNGILLILEKLRL